MAEYYADLNPRFGARHEGRYAVFNRETRSPVYGMHYTTRKAAERNAAKLTEQERDPLADDLDGERGACILTAENMHTEDDCTMHDHETP